MADTDCTKIFWLNKIRLISTVKLELPFIRLWAHDNTLLYLPNYHVRILATLAESKRFITLGFAKRPLLDPTFIDILFNLEIFFLHPGISFTYGILLLYTYNNTMIKICIMFFFKISTTYILYSLLQSTALCTCHRPPEIPILRGTYLPTLMFSNYKISFVIIYGINRNIHFNYWLWRL